MDLPACLDPTRRITSLSVSGLIVNPTGRVIVSRAMLLIPCLVFLLAADAAEDAKKDLEKCQGTWVPVLYEVDGKPAADEEKAKIELVIKGDQSTLSKGKEPRHGSYKLSPGKKPKELDILLTDGPDKGKTLPAIYEIEGDILKICLARTGKDRPKELVSKPGSGHVLEVWKRRK